MPTQREGRGHAVGLVWKRETCSAVGHHRFTSRVNSWSTIKSKVLIAFRTHVVIIFVNFFVVMEIGIDQSCWNSESYGLQELQVEKYRAQIKEAVGVWDNKPVKTLEV